MEQRGRTYCVTGANGYVGSWLVKFLLEKGHTVHATVRNPANCDHVVTSWGGVNDRLKLFKADMHEEGSFDDAVQGCYGIFLVAASLDDAVVTTKDDKYVQSTAIDPSIKGALNVLKSCIKSKSVKRVVFTSSVTTLTARNDRGEWLPVVDESCQIRIDIAWKTKTAGWVYVLSKRLTEDALFKYANENGINLVSIITGVVAGPFLISTVPFSMRTLLSPVTGDSELLPLLSELNETTGSIALVHTEDICNAHLYLMEHDQAHGRYICCTNSCTMSELVDHFAKIYPLTNSHRFIEAESESIIPSEISSKKLKDLGFRYKYDLQQVIHQAVDSCIHSGFLPPIKTEKK